MRSRGAASFAGLCLLASCAFPQQVPIRGQYCVSFKIASGKLAVGHDTFRVAQSQIKFESAIRLTVLQAIEKIGPLSPDLLIDSAWPDYIEAFENWSAANPDRLDLGTLFSADFLFADVLTQTPDSGLILNEDDIDPLNGAISFSILPFDSNALRIDLPAMLDSRRRTRTSQLRKRLARLNGSLWSSSEIRKALGPLYANLGLTPQVLVLPRNQAIQIIEGPRIASIVLPADQVSARDVDRVLWDLLDTGHFRKARGKRIVDFDRDLGYAPGDEPYAIQYQIQAMQLLISPLGYTLTTEASTRSGASQYVELLVQKASKKPKRHLGAGFTYKPGQGFSALGVGQLSSLTLSGGGPYGTLGSGSYSASYLGFSGTVNTGVSIDRNRLLDGVKVDEQSTAESATLEWEPWRGLDGNTITLGLVPSHAVVLNQTLNTITPGVELVHDNFTSEHPSRMFIHPRVLIGLGFTDYIVTANTHRAFDHWEYDLSGRLENAAGNPPIFELPSLGGADTVRGFRADDAIGRRLWSLQSELWHGLPRWSLLKIATFIDLGGAYQTTGSYPGLREGLGTGLRLDLRLAVLKFDWAYGFGQAATGGSRGKFYFNVVFPNH
jgi:Omp85 superfamily domain